MTYGKTMRNKEIIKKSKYGESHEELAKEYNLSLSRINKIIEEYAEFDNYCNDMERLISQDQINEDTKLYEMAKLLEFDARSINGLKCKGIKSIEELIALTEEEIWTLRNIGKVSREHIKKCIENYMKNNANSKICKNKTIEIENSQVNAMINEQFKMQNIKANRYYICKLIDLMDSGEFSTDFIKKEINKEFNKLEKANEQLIELLKNNL